MLGSVLASAGDDGTIRLWWLGGRRGEATTKAVSAFNTPATTQTVEQASQAASAVNTPACVACVSSGGGPVLALCGSGALLVSAGHAGRVALWAVDLGAARSGATSGGSGAISGGSGAISGGSGAISGVISPLRELRSACGSIGALAILFNAKPSPDPVLNTSPNPNPNTIIFILPLTLPLPLPLPLPLSLPLILPLPLALTLILTRRAGNPR